MTDALASSLTFDFGAAGGPGEGAPSAEPPRPRRACARGVSAVSKVNRSWSVRCLTGAAFPPRALGDAVGPTFRWACGTMQRSDFCWAIAFRSFVLRATEACSEPSRSHRVRAMSFVTIPSPLRAIIGSDGNRASPLQAGSPTGRASPALYSRSTWSHTYDFYRTRPRGEGRGTARSLLRRLPAQTCPCHLGDGFPPSGPRVWTCTSWTWFVPITPAQSVAGAPLCLLSGLAAHAHVRRAKKTSLVTFRASARATAESKR